MNILIYYFSGTGNTHKVTEKYKQSFEKAGHTVKIVSLPVVNEDDLIVDGFDIVGLAYPIHGFNAPKILLDLAKSLPFQKSTKKTFIFKTSGEPVLANSVSSLKLKKLLKKKNFSVDNEFRYVMPYNMIFRHTEHRAAVMWETAQKLVPLDVAKIINGENTYEHRFFMDSAFAWILRIEHFGAWLNGFFYRVNGDCIHCGKCVKNCPTHNITEMANGKFHFSNKCTMCVRCSFQCPTSAISIGMFNFMKVNGVYKFSEPTEPEIDKHENYCRKAYEEYFKEAEKRIAEGK